MTETKQKSAPRRCKTTAGHFNPNSAEQFTRPPAQRVAPPLTWDAPEASLKAELCETIRYLRQRGVRESEDLAQEIFLGLWKKRGRKPDALKFLARRRASRAKSAYRKQMRDAERRAELSPAAWQCQADLNASHEGVLRQEEIALLLGRLPVADQRLLILHHGHGVPLRLIVKLGRPFPRTISALKSKLFRLRKALQADARVLFGSDQEARNQLGLA